jgi:AAA ATPase
LKIQGKELGGGMFQTIDIKAYRGLKNITLQNLSRVNILVGENNTGKTSILEAIQLLRDPEVVDNVLSIAKKRQPRNIMVQSANLIPFDEFLYSFPVQGEQKDIVIYATDYELKKWHIELCGTIKKEIFDKEDLSESEQRRYDLYCGEDGEISVISGNFLYISENLTSENSYSFRETQLRPDVSMKETLDIKKENMSRVSIVYISPMDVYTNRVLNANFYKGMRVSEKETLIQLLRLFDERIIGIEIGMLNAKPTILIELENIGLMPVSLFGDGLKKILTLASAIVKTKHGIILIDEFETGIHQRALVQVADWIASAAEERDIQIFLTTHSSEAVNALVQAQKKQQIDMSAYRLELYMGDTFVKQFRSDELLELVNKQGMDIL